MNLQQTGRYLYETSVLEDSGQTIDEEKWQLLSTVSEENLCDMAHKKECSKDKVYFTDDQWAITYWCTHHLNQQIKDGTFVETK